MTTHRTALLLLLIPTLLAGVAASAATLTVPADFPDLQDALDAAAAGDTILIAAGTHTRDLQSAPDELLRTRYVIPAPVVLAGATGDPADVILDGQGYGRVLTCAEGLSGLVIRDLTVADGDTSPWGPTDGAGGGLACRGGDITLENCILRGNVTGWKNEGGGAGAYLAGGTALIRDCVFRDNRADEGGSGDSGALKLAGVTGQVVDCVFERNRAASAGAMAVAFGPGDVPADVTVTGCRFEDNLAAVFGGAATVWQWCTARFEKCLFLNNTAGSQSGGALRVGDAAVTVQSCRFERNAAGTEGGAIYGAHWSTAPSTIDLLDCTLVDNTAGASGGALHLLTGVTLYGWNTDFSGNAAPAGPEGSVDAGGTATLACCLADLSAWTGAVILDNDGCAVATEPTTWGGIKAMFR